MNVQKLLCWIVLGAFLSGCGLTRDWTTRQTTAATAAAACAIIGGNAAGWVNHNNGHKLSEGQAIPAGVFGGALLCGGLAYLLTPEPPPPPPKPAPPHRRRHLLLRRLHHLRSRHLLHRRHHRHRRRRLSGQSYWMTYCSILTRARLSPRRRRFLTVWLCS